MISSSPLLVGIRPGSTLPLKMPVPLTCSTEYTSSVQSIEWLVNGRKTREDFILLTKSGQVISSWLFVPEIGDVVLECKIKGSQERSSFVFFSVNKDTKTVNIENSSNRQLNNQATSYHLQLVILCILLTNRVNDWL